MRIEITHKETHVQIDEFQPKDVDSAVKMIQGTIDAIQGIEPAERPEIDLTQWKAVDTKTLEPIHIHRDASECLRMLKYWDEHSLRNQGDEIVHPDIAESNTMKVVKTFLESLIRNFREI